MKNHKWVDGQLRQTNKKYSHLKNSQKEFIANAMESECRKYVRKNGLFPMSKHSHDVVEAVYEKIEKKKIWIPYGEVYKQFMSKKTKMCNKFLKEGFIERQGKKRFVLNRKVILYIAMSLDGYIADEGGGVDWLNQFNETSSMDDYAKFYKNTDVIISGRKTYEQVLGFGYPYKGKKMYVYSNSKMGADEYAEYTNTPPKELILSLKSQLGQDIWLLGGADLIRSFLKDDLIDEYQIAVMPIILGKGISLFDNVDKTLKLEIMPKRAVKGFDILMYRKPVVLTTIDEFEDSENDTN